MSGTHGGNLEGHLMSIKQKFEEHYIIYSITLLLVGGASSVSAQLGIETYFKRQNEAQAQIVAEAVSEALATAKQEFADEMAKAVSKAVATAKQEFADEMKAETSAMLARVETTVRDTYASEANSVFASNMSATSNGRWGTNLHYSGGSAGSARANTNVGETSPYYTIGPAGSASFSRGKSKE